VYDLSSLMCYHVLVFGYPVLYLHLFKASLLFSHLSFFVLLLSELSSLFMHEKIGLRQVVR
jgi:drug/metabolite transporter (DMT)-like permease